MLTRLARLKLRKNITHLHMHREIGCDKRITDTGSLRERDGAQENSTSSDIFGQPHACVIFPRFVIHITCMIIPTRRAKKKKHFLISWTEGEALEVVRGAQREPGLDQWRRLPAFKGRISKWEKSGRQQADLVTTESRQNRRPLAHHSSLGKFGTTSPRAHWRPVA